jgi:hypothetical protein
MLGFLTHSGYSHGGNGFEGMAFLLEQFKDADLKDPTNPKHGLDLKAMAIKFAEAYKEEKTQSKEAGFDGPRALPGVHHPIFKGKPVNYDPRERFIVAFMEKRGDYNIFHAFYRELVQALYETGSSRYVFCVNVDAVIAALQLAVCVSSRVNDARSAQQIGALIILPLAALLVGQLTGSVTLTGRVMLVLTLGLLAANVVLMRAGVVLFQRESILTRWK